MYGRRGRRSYGGPSTSTHALTWRGAGSARSLERLPQSSYNSKRHAQHLGGVGLGAAIDSSRESASRDRQARGRPPRLRTERIAEIRCPIIGLRREGRRPLVHDEGCNPTTSPVLDRTASRCARASLRPSVMISSRCRPRAGLLWLTTRARSLRLAPGI